MICTPYQTSPGIPLPYDGATGWKRLDLSKARSEAFYGPTLSFEAKTSPKPELEQQIASSKEAATTEHPLLDMCGQWCMDLTLWLGPIDLRPPNLAISLFQLAGYSHRLGLY
jgi:hypothetical protein